MINGTDLEPAKVAPTPAPAPALALALALAGEGSMAFRPRLAQTNCRWPVLRLRLMSSTQSLASASPLTAGAGCLTFDNSQRGRRWFWFRAGLLSWGL